MFKLSPFIYKTENHLLTVSENKIISYFEYGWIREIYQDFMVLFAEIKFVDTMIKWNDEII